MTTAAPSTALAPVPEGSLLVPDIETAGVGIAAQMKATVESRYLMALQRPRNAAKVREAILAACQRPAFAEEAKYSLPRGQGKAIEGLTVRFAEEVVRAMGNIMIDGAVVHEDVERRIIRVVATDMEMNLTYATDVVVTKTVERRVKGEREMIGTRMNAENERLYILKATDEEVQMKQNSLISKALRNAVLRFLPADIQEEALGTITGRVTATASDKKEMAKAITRLERAFAAVRVSREELEGFLGHKLEEMNAEELSHLNGIGQSIKEGTIEWAQVAANVPQVRRTHPTHVRDPHTGYDQAGKSAPGTGQQRAPAEEREGPKAEVKDMSTAPRPQGPKPPDPYLHNNAARRSGKCEHGVDLNEECQECRELHGGA